MRETVLKIPYTLRNRVIKYNYKKNYSFFVENKEDHIKRSS